MKNKIDYSGCAYPKIQPMRSESYKKFIRSLPCLICGRDSEHHHEPLEFDSRGTALKGPDNEAMPLCVIHHTADRLSRHRMGREKFYSLYNIDWRKVIVEYQRRFKESEFF